MNEVKSPNASSRRRFLRNVGGATAATLAASAVGLPSIYQLGINTAQAAEVGSQNGSQRVSKAYQVRHKAALDQKAQPLPAHPTNGDDETYPNFIASYSKGLPHNHLGEPNVAAYNALLQAMTSGDAADFAAIPMGGTVKQTNPQSALSFEMDGADSHHLGIPAPPAFSSEDHGADMAEVYWQALTRDIPFSQYGTDQTIAQAVTDLKQFSRFSGINIANVFRGETSGDLNGPYISQFLWKTIPYGPTAITQKYKVPTPGKEYMTQHDEWLRIQSGGAPSSSQTYPGGTRFITNGRDLTEYVHRDFTYQAFLNAGLILLGFGGAALDDANPYKSSTNQSSFCTFGGPHLLDLVARVANCALKAAWYQKWAVHRRLRPEATAGRVHNHLTGAASYPLHAKLLKSQAVGEVFKRTGAYLLPMAYSEGSPTHPSYPAGHATIAGACTTILKAFFKESFIMPSPVVPTDDGQDFVAYSGTLTVGGELNKLAANISIGRDTAGVHYRSDGIEGMNLGEALAISVLRDYSSTFNESFAGFSLTKFDGTSITI